MEARSHSLEQADRAETFASSELEFALLEVLLDLALDSHAEPKLLVVVV